MEAGNCKDAVPMIETLQFNFALLDYQLPDGTGLDLVPMLRAANSNIHIALMSAADDSALVARVRANGIDLYLPKPIRTQALDTLIQRVLQD